MGASEYIGQRMPVQLDVEPLHAALISPPIALMLSLRISDIDTAFRMN
jgi:hypothetical protein